MSIHTDKEIKKRQAIIFDCNGTVADTERVRFLVVKKLLTECGINLSSIQEDVLYHELLGATLLRASEYIVRVFKLRESIQELTERQAKLLIQECETSLEYMPGFLPFIYEVKKRGIKVALASNSSKKLLEVISKKLELDVLFKEHIYDLSCVTRPKPAPDLYLYAAQQLHVDTTECIAVEDSIRGVGAAVQAGMLCIGLNALNKDAIKDAHVIVARYVDIDLDYVLSR